MSCLFLTRLSAVSLTDEPIPSGIPLPCPASKKFHVVNLNPNWLMNKLKRKKLFFCLYCAKGPSLKKCNVSMPGNLAAISFNTGSMHAQIELGSCLKLSDTAQNETFFEAVK